MKRFIYILLIIVNNGYGQFIDSTEAINLAVMFFNYKDINYNQKYLNLQRYKWNNKIYLYLIHSENRSVLISSDYQIGPFLAYSEDNIINFFNDNGEENYWISYYKSIFEYKDNLEELDFRQQDILNKINNGVKSENSNRFFLIKTKWGQDLNYESGCGYNNDKCYNKFVGDNNAGQNCFCNKCPAGCVAIAVAQIMRYWKFPYLQYDWCNMPAYITTQSPIEQVDAIARLIADVGNAVKMEYCNGGCNSSSTDIKAEKALKETFNYHESVDIIRKGWYTADNWKKIIRAQLDNRRPVYYSGCKKITGYCHAFICDGYDYDDPDFFHFNFGWGGNSDGFYYIFDDDGDNLLNYHYYQHAIINIRPSYDYSCNYIFTVKEIYQVFPESEITYYHPTFGIIQTAMSPDNVIISSGEHVHYRAHHEIILNDGFIADYGSEFIAENVPCPVLCDVETLSNKRYLSQNMFNRNYDSDLAWEVLIYPNPFGDYVIIENLNKLRVKEVSIYNALGREVYRNKVNSNSITIETTTYNAGVYLLKIYDNKEVRFTKIIKVNYTKTY